AERGENQAGSIQVEAPQARWVGVPEKADVLGQAERLDVFAKAQGVDRSALPADEESHPEPATEDGKGIEQPRQVLVGKQVPDEQDVRVLGQGRSGAISVGVEQIRVEARIHDSHRLRKDLEAPDDVAARALRISDDPAGQAQGPRYEMPEIPLLPGVF